MEGHSPTRRNFLKTGLLAAGGLGLGLAAYRGLRNRGEPPPPHPELGPLRPVRDESSGLPLLMLPEGFRYHTFGWAGQAMSDGFATPGRADGMGAVSAENERVYLVRNHELRGSSGPIGNPATAWDNTGGGTTTLVWNTARERLEEDFVSLNGTLNNCAGGITPWGTWLSCEEAVFAPEAAHYGIQVRQKLWRIGRAKKPHGYVFEVPAGGVSSPEPIVDMGQFWHEAAAVDPASGFVYQTEDNPRAGLYRFLPREPGNLSAGGQLQMLKVEGFEDLSEGVPLFQPMDTNWVDIEDPGRGNTPGTHDGQGVVMQGMRAGGSIFRSLEGCDYVDGQLYFTSKNGGAAQGGYIFRLDLERSLLELLYESPGRGGFSGPDNIVFSPRGSLVVCEDREQGNQKAQYLAGLSTDGGLFAFARVNPGISGIYRGHDLASTALVSEWAGACFSPDGQWMFANLYFPGVTIAITGPWVEGLI